MADLESLLARLTRNRVRYVVVGGYAAMAHGASRITQDIDVCCPFTPGNLMRLHQALRDLHPVHRMTPKRLPLVLSRETCQEFKNLYLDTDLGQIDCLSEIAGLGTYEAVRRSSDRVRLPWGSCRVLTLESLIRAKEAMPRPQDRVVLGELRAIELRLRKP